MSVSRAVPNVLATRYAGADLAEIWSPEHKIVLERQLWVAVLKAQRDLGISDAGRQWVVTAYAILRHRGLPLGKYDFLGQITIRA